MLVSWKIKRWPKLDSETAMLDHHEASIPRGLKLGPGQRSAPWQSEL
jgi:hypothetical protein